MKKIKKYYQEIIGVSILAAGVSGLFYLANRTSVEHAERESMRKKSVKKRMLKKQDPKTIAEYKVHFIKGATIIEDLKTGKCYSDKKFESTDVTVENSRTGKTYKGKAISIKDNKKAESLMP